ncbi:MAG: hypothetical protein WAT09_06500 [Paracoccaceae bacterium]
MPRPNPVLPFCLLVIALAALPHPIHAEDRPNLALPSEITPLTAGDVQKRALAWQLFAIGKLAEDPIFLLTAIRLARSTDQRAATGWTRDGVALTPDTTPNVTADGPGSDATMALAVLMAEGDPALADLAADVQADLARPSGARGHVSIADAQAQPGKIDTWRMAFYGQVRAEVAIFGQRPLGLTVTDESGASVCQKAGPATIGYCQFTPERNGYFIVQVTNPTATAIAYSLISN